MICRICLLKNRKQEEAREDRTAIASTGANTYNNTSFKNNIRTTSDQHGYASAGFAEIRRPNKPIALTVLYHLYRYLLHRMQQDPDWSIKDKMAFSDWMFLQWNVKWRDFCQAKISLVA